MNDIIYISLLLLTAFLLRKNQKKIKSLSESITVYQNDFKERYAKIAYLEDDNQQLRDTIKDYHQLKLDLPGIIEKERADAIVRSKAINAGQASENIVIFNDKFKYNPKDCRQLGQPIDFVIFDGLDAGELQGIVFLEVKTGGSRMNKREVAIKNIIAEGKIKHEVFNIKKPKEEK